MSEAMVLWNMVDCATRFGSWSSTILVKWSMTLRGGIMQALYRTIRVKKKSSQNGKAQDLVLVLSSNSYLWSWSVVVTDMSFILTCRTKWRLLGTQHWGSGARTLEKEWWWYPPLSRVFVSQYQPCSSFDPTRSAWASQPILYFASTQGSTRVRMTYISSSVGVGVGSVWTSAFRQFVVAVWTCPFPLTYIPDYYGFQHNTTEHT